MVQEKNHIHHFWFTGFVGIPSGIGMTRKTTSQHAYKQPHLARVKKLIHEANPSMGQGTCWCPPSGLAHHPPPWIHVKVGDMKGMALAEFPLNWMAPKQKFNWALAFAVNQGSPSVGPQCVRTGCQKRVSPHDRSCARGMSSESPPLFMLFDLQLPVLLEDCTSQLAELICTLVWWL